MRLIVGICTEYLRFLRRNRRIAFDKSRHHTTCCLNTERERSYIQKNESIRLIRLNTAQNGSLYGGTERHGLIGINALAQLFTIEKLLEKLLDTRNTRRTADEHNLMDLFLAHLGIAENLLNRTHTFTELAVAERLEFCPCENYVEILTIRERINFHGRLRRRRENAFRTFR